MRRLLGGGDIEDVKNRERTLAGRWGRELVMAGRWDSMFLPPGEGKKLLSALKILPTENTGWCGWRAVRGA